MSIYKENPEKLSFTLSNTKSNVKIKIDCLHGTDGRLSFFFGSLKQIHCDEEEIVGNAAELKNRSLKFQGGGNNPDNLPFRVEHTIAEDGGNTLVYTFPDDYSGTPIYDENDENPDYEFTIKFILP